MRPFLVAGAVIAVGVGAVVVVAGDRVGNAVKEVTLPLRYDSIIRQQAEKKRLDPALVAAVIFVESRFTSRTSPAGAQGLMQIMPATAHAIAKRSGGTRFEEADLQDPQVNIAYGTYYLRLLLDKYHGSEPLALAAYNAGQSNVDRWVAEARRKGEAADSPTVVHFPETRAYVRNVLRTTRSYKRKYPDELRPEASHP